MKVSDPLVFEYDTEIFKFRELVDAIFRTNGRSDGYVDLESIHEVYDYDVFDRRNDQNTKWHSIYYDNFDKFLKPVYEEFIQYEIKERLFGDSDKEIIYQKVPTIRTHLVGNKGVGEFHKDSDYNHTDSEINVIVPLTDMKGNQSVWIETEPDGGDFVSMELERGQMLVFDGVNYTHGNKINDTDQSRVSFDFRVADPDEFTPSDQGSVNMKSKFRVGGYFSKG